MTKRKSTLKIKLHKVMEEHDFTPEKLEELSGVSVPTIYRYKDERSEPSMALLLQLADAMGVDFERMYEIETKYYKD